MSCLPLPPAPSRAERTCERYGLTIALVLRLVPVAFAQPSPRFDVGPVVRVDRVMVESGLHGVMPVIGLVGSARFSNTWGVRGRSRRRAAISPEL